MVHHKFLVGKKCSEKTRSVCVSRSASVVIAYLMSHELDPATSRPFTLRAAFDFVHKQRPIIHPRKNFVEELRKLEEELWRARGGSEAEAGAAFTPTLTTAQVMDALALRHTYFLLCAKMLCVP